MYKSYYAAQDTSFSWKNAKSSPILDDVPQGKEGESDKESKWAAFHEEKYYFFQLHDLIVLLQPLFLNLILNISSEYFQPQRVLIKNWTCFTKITRNCSKDFHFHRLCKSFWGKFLSKNILQVSSGLFSHLPLPRTKRWPPEPPSWSPPLSTLRIFGKYGHRPLFLHIWPHFHPANNGKCSPSRSVSIPPPAHRWLQSNILSEIFAPPLLTISHSTQNSKLVANSS